MRGLLRGPLEYLSLKLLAWAFHLTLEIGLLQLGKTSGNWGEIRGN